MHVQIGHNRAAAVLVYFFIILLHAVRLSASICVLNYKHSFTFHFPVSSKRRKALKMLDKRPLTRHNIKQAKPYSVDAAPSAAILQILPPNDGGQICARAYEPEPLITCLCGSRGPGFLRFCLNRFPCRSQLGAGLFARRSAGGMALLG